MEERFILEGHTTIKIGECPILEIKSDAIISSVVSAVNFLRSGCPRVQLVYSESSESKKVKNNDSRFYNFKKIRGYVEEALADIALPGSPDESFTTSSSSNSKEPFLIIIRRSCSY
jgi:hypothetical protein